MGFLDSYKQKSLIKKGNSFYRQEKYLEALDCYDRIILEIDSNCAEAWYQKGLVLSGCKKHKEAIESLDKSIKLDSKNVEAWYIKGLSLAVLRENQEASDCFEKALELNPDFEPAKESLKLINWLNSVQSSKNNRKPNHNEKKNKEIQSRLL